jgi:iron complex transport system substrate-binding protein
MCVTLVLLAGLALALWFTRGSAPAPAPEARSHGDEARIVSLAPSVTETLFALGAGAHVVGVSDYCHFPPEVARLPRVGSAITPAFETIARLAPTLIVASDVGGEQTGPLSRIARTERLPWLSLAEVVQSTQRLGTLVGREEAGRALAERLERTLSVTPPANAPRVLLALSYGDVGSSDVWFIRDDSLHGAALRAAGGQNAVIGHARGQPRLSLEEVLRVDPDQIVVLVDSALAANVTTDAALGPWRRLTPLRAVQSGRLGVVRTPGALNGGPRILEVVAPLAAEIRRLAALQ